MALEQTVTIQAPCLHEQAAEHANVCNQRCLLHTLASAADLHSTPSRSAPANAGNTAEREREKELELIKQQYLGADKTRKKALRPSEKFRFNFDWDAGEDTSKDLNPLYNQTHEAALLFGRGMRAGEGWERGGWDEVALLSGRGVRAGEGWERGRMG